MSRALDGGVRRVDLSLGQALVLMAASVVEHVEVILDTNDDQRPWSDADLASLATDVLVDGTDILGTHALTGTDASARDTSPSTKRASDFGRASSISRKKP